ncbi:hypothetical protein [Cupriavidus taiwanensis]|nr:hypothetical protein [Cupriavidus taiwanensis]
MGAEVMVSSAQPRLQQLERALDDIGVTPSQKKILALILTSTESTPCSA